MSLNPTPLAKIIWDNPETGSQQEFILTEGSSVSLGRSPDNEVYIPERTISRHHAAITYRAGVFVVADTDSANGVFVNDIQVKKDEPYPLIHGDSIRLYMTPLKFAAIVPDSLLRATIETPAGSRPRLLITSGSLIGTEISITKDAITFGRAIANASWDVALPDHAVSRPHARIYTQENTWYVEDLRSSNGTMVDGEYISKPIVLQEGTNITIGETTLVFHLSA